MLYYTKINHTLIPGHIAHLINNYYKIYCLQMKIFFYYPLFLITKFNRHLFLLELDYQIISIYKTNLSNRTFNWMLLSQVTNFPQYRQYY